MSSGIVRILKWLLYLLITAAAMIATGNLFIIGQTETRVYTDLALIPENKVGVLLGTSKHVSNGDLNPHFQTRIKAAALLYAQGKIKHILASGDNETEFYDEPSEMKKALMREGVPDSAITLDKAGLRTLDSVVRAKEIFGLEKFTVITEAFHTYRAVFISRHYNLDAVAFAAEDVPPEFAVRSGMREWLARIWMLMDLYLFGAEPKYLGQPEPITFPADSLAQDSLDARSDSARSPARNPAKADSIATPIADSTKGRRDETAGDSLRR
ncbi:MAG: YdcF family protein [Rhizobacter sp.]|nr:YdcF family protein [Chlorobiales bacterium]